MARTADPHIYFRWADAGTGEAGSLWLWDGPEGEAEEVTAAAFTAQVEGKKSFLPV